MEFWLWSWEAKAQREGRGKAGGGWEAARKESCLRFLEGYIVCVCLCVCLCAGFLRVGWET